MTSPCRDCLAALLETAPEKPPQGSSLGAHLGGCANCRAAFERMCAIRSGFAGLPRLRTPESLDGLVVASMQAGHRQERAVAHLRTALRHAAPAQLEQQLDGGFLLGNVARVAAPAVLARLVDEDLRDPEHALTRRYVSRLQRLGPPTNLRDRVHAMLGAPKASPNRNVLLGLAALAVLFASMWGWWSLEHSRLRPRFQVVYVSDLDQLDPLARDMLSGLTGGSSELPGVAR